MPVLFAGASTIQPILSSASNPFCAALPVPSAYRLDGLFVSGLGLPVGFPLSRASHARFLFQKAERVTGLNDWNAAYNRRKE